MNAPRFVGAVVALALAVLPAQAAAAAPDDDLARAVAALGSSVASAGIPAAVVVLAGATGEPLGAGVGRRADGGPVTPDTRVVIGSTSKSVTALAVMQLVDDGVVDLDAPVRRYVPELRLADPAAAGAITVRHLLQQTSGLAETAGGPVLKSARDGTALEAVGELAGAVPVDPPGTAWHYSNANYVLAGLVVERASPDGYAEHLRRRILGPLRMTATSVTPRAADGTGPEPGHRIWFGAVRTSGPAHRTGLAAAGYLVSTPRDLGRYLQLYLRDGLAPDGMRVVSAAGLRTLTAPGPQAHLGGWADGAQARYAMGWFVGGPWREPVLFHPGNTPDSSAMIVLAPRRGTAVVTTMSLSHELPLPGNPSVTERTARDVVAAVLGEPGGAGPSASGFYLRFDAVVLLLVAGAVLLAARSVRALRRRTRPRRRWLALLGALTLAGAAVVVLAAPSAVGYGWRGLFVWAPDLALATAVVGALLAASALLRLAGVLRSRSPGTTGGPPSAVGDGRRPVTTGGQP
jgi:CubicO group peptidase (beta-lactamase class C family)